MPLQVPLKAELPEVLGEDVPSALRLPESRLGNSAVSGISVSRLSHDLGAIGAVESTAISRIRAAVLGSWPFIRTVQGGIENLGDGLHLRGQTHASPVC